MTIVKSLTLIRACRSIEPCLFVTYFSTMFHTILSYFHPTFQGHIFFIRWRVLVSSVERISGESKGVDKLLTEFPEAIELSAGRRSRV